MKLGNLTYHGRHFAVIQSCMRSFHSGSYSHCTAKTMINLHAGAASKRQSSLKTLIIRQQSFGLLLTQGPLLNSGFLSKDAFFFW
jgi:hypothetical protein